MLSTQLAARRLIVTAPNAIPRFWASLRCPPIESACWTWRRPTPEGEEPLMSIRGRQVQASRIAYYLVTNHWPLACRRDRLCENRLCVRPSHGRWRVGATTRRALESAGEPCPEEHAIIEVEEELAAARRAGLFEEFWAASA